MKSIKQAQVDKLLTETHTIGSFAHEMSKFGVYVVKPKETVSAVFFMGEKRYFPILNEDDIVVGGYFG